MPYMTNEKWDCVRSFAISILTALVSVVWIIWTTTSTKCKQLYRRFFT